MCWYDDYYSTVIGSVKIIISTQSRHVSSCDVFASGDGLLIRSSVCCPIFENKFHLIYKVFTDMFAAVVNEFIGQNDFYPNQIIWIINRCSL